MQDATDYTGHAKPAMQDATDYGQASPVLPSVPDGSWIYDHDHKPETQPAPWSPVMPAWQARAEQARRDQVARDRAAQDRFYAGPMAATYGDDGR